MHQAGFHGCGSRFGFHDALYEQDTVVEQRAPHYIEYCGQAGVPVPQERVGRVLRDGLELLLGLEQRLG